MDEKYNEELQESLKIWTKIDMILAIQRTKDQPLIRKFCSKNDFDDIRKTIQTLKNHKGVPTHDKQIIIAFELAYPDNLTTKLISQYLDLTDIYSDFLRNMGVSLNNE